MIQAFVYLMNGEAYDLSLPAHATIRDVKEAIPNTFSWRVRLIPYELPNEESAETQSLKPLDDSLPVEDKTSFRGFMDTTDTRVFYFEKGTNPFHAMSNHDLLSRLSVYYLETDQRTSGADVLEQTAQTEYYFDMESINEWSSPTIKDPLAVFLKMCFKGTYKGLIDRVKDRYQVYRTKCVQSVQKTLSDDE